MSELLTSVVASASLAFGVLVFGVAPGAVLRVIVLAFGVTTLGGANSSENSERFRVGSGRFGSQR